MGLLSIFQRKSGPSARSAVPQDAVVIAAERTRARRRLVGAVVLVLVGVIGFPLLFDTAPRPLPVDMPIEIPSREAAPPLASASGARAAQGTVAEAPLPTASAVIPAASAPPAADKPEPPAESPAEPKPANKPPEAPEPAPAVKQAEAARAQAALEGKPITAKPADAPGRFVVQVGAFSEAESARDARARVEKLGLKTYTQVIETSSGKRIRVRVGPYDDRAEAEKAAARIKQAGISAAVRAP